LSANVISGNIEEEFKSATSKVVPISQLPKNVQQGMKRRAVSGITVDRVAQQYYNPSI